MFNKLRRLQRLPQTMSGEFRPQMIDDNAALKLELQREQQDQKYTEGQAAADACLRYISEDIRIRYISGDACLQTRDLWEEVFSEDSELFTEYYFRVKAPQNEGVVLEGKEGLRAMMFLTPENLRVFEKEVRSAYIVGVATREQFRHRGYMARLLQASMTAMYERWMPFVFLMPASAAIYEPFDFRFIYDRPVWDARSLRRDLLRPLGTESVGKIAFFSQEFLKNTTAVHICRDAAYDKVLLEELAAQEGTVFGFFDGAADVNHLCGVCLYTCEGGEADIQEVLAMPEAEARFISRCPEKKPCIMARIVHLPAMLGLLRAADGAEAFSFLLQVTDPQIAENNGCFLCHADGQGCEVRKIEETEADQKEADKRAADKRGAEEYQASGSSAFWSGSIAELVQQIFGYENERRDELWGRLRLLNPVWINEIV